MECKFGCYEREKSLTEKSEHVQGKNLQRSFATLEAETKSDSQVENLINIAQFKANFMGKLHTIRLRTGYYNNQS